MIVVQNRITGGLLRTVHVYKKTWLQSILCFILCLL